MQSMQQFRLDRIPDNLLREPLAFLIADHMRQHKMCNAINAIHLAHDKAWPPAMAQSIFDYLAEDFRLHILDEENDLYPALRTTPGHELNDLIDASTRNHAIELSLASDIIVLLKRWLSHQRHNASNVSPFLNPLVVFTDCLRRHLAIEDQMLMPLARKHLAESDLDRIGRAMAQRRNIDYPE